MPQSGQTTAKQLFHQLTEDSTKHNLTQQRRDEVLEQLKVLGRDPSNVRELYNTSGIQVLGHFALGSYPRSTAREALRCIANALILLPPTQESFISLGLAPRAAESLHTTTDDDDEFLLCRILFLLTYNRSIDLEGLVNNHDLADSVISHISRHATSVKPTSAGQGSVAALSETLKLLFNITNANADYIARFNPVVPDLLKLIITITIPTPPLQPPLTYILNGLAALDLQPTSNGEPETTSTPMVSHLGTVIESLISILDRSIQEYTPMQLDTQAVPLLTLLRKINEVGPQSLRKRMKEELLPKDSERDLPLGKSSSLASQLLRLTTSPGLTHLPEVISSLLFELSDKDATVFVKNVGYGFAAGYLMSHKIPIPENIKKSQGSAEQVPINPVTGQRLDREPEAPVVNMTQEEKEREAERLFVLFERLNATGVVKGQNPVRQAMEEGRFEELSDSDPE